MRTFPRGNCSPRPGNHHPVTIVGDKVVTSDSSLAEPVTPQQGFVDGDCRFRPFRNGDRDEKDVARNVTCHIYVRHTGFFRGWVRDDPSLFIAFATKALRKVRCLMATDRKKTGLPDQGQDRF